MDNNLITICVTCNNKDIIKTFASATNAEKWLQQTGYKLVYVEVKEQA